MLEGLFLTRLFKVHSEDELRERALRILEKVDVGIVEEHCVGNDYRVVVLNGKCISAYQRIPLSVIGNGKDSINELIAIEKDALLRCGRPNSEIDINDDRIDTCLMWQGYNREYVLGEAEQIFLLDNANLSTGGKSVDCADAVHESFIRIALAANDALNLTFSGVDIICQDIALAADKQTWKVLEVNGSPGLDNYSASGEKQIENTKKIYREVMKSLRDS